MSLSNAFENALALLIANNTNIANVGDATGLRGSTTAGNLYFALHTADPGEAGDQTTSEATYTSYVRLAVARNSGALTVTNNVITNTLLALFAQCTGGTNTITHVSLGVASAGASVIIASGALGASLAVANGIAPKFEAGTFSLTWD